MKAIKGKVELELRNGISILLSDTVKLSVDEKKEFGFLYKTTLGRYTSVFSQITEIEKREGETIFKLDKRIAGEIGDGDSAELIFSATPPQAEIVYLAIQKQVPLPQGDWSKIVKEGNIGKIIDYGNNLSFVVPAKLREPFVVSTQIVTSLPYPPAKIHEGTKFQLIKRDQSEFTRILADALKARKNRAEELEKAVISGYYEKIIELKNDKLESLGRSIEFHTEPRLAFDTLKSAFTSYFTFQENVSLESGDNFIGNLMFVTSKTVEGTEIVEMIISGKERSGNIAIWIYGEDSETIQNKMKKEILPKILQVIEGVKEGPELIPMYCAGNCGEMLDLELFDENGLSKCPACDTLNMLPSKLRV